MRIDDIELANATMLPFSRDGPTSNLNVHEMQCMWYEIEVGNSFIRKKNFRSALKNFNRIEKHFEQFYEDQFDFHMYAFRKFVILNYIEMIDFEDNLF